DVPINETRPISPTGHNTQSTPPITSHSINRCFEDNLKL
ncbi:unnamed protein product, partial [Rotaria sordida]